MSKTSLVYVFLLSIFISACGGGGNSPSIPTPGDGSLGGCTGTSVTELPASPNNAAILSGCDLGAGSSSNASLRKQLQLEIVSPHPDLTLEAPFLTSLSSDFVYVMIKVNNISSNLHCFIKASSIDYLDAANNILTFDSLDYVEGSLGVGVGSIITTSTCLNSGESGYLLLIDSSDNLFANSTKIRINNITTSPSSFSPSPVTLLPVSYETYPSLIYDFKLKASVKNTSTTNAKLDTISFSKFVLLDTKGDALGWGFTSGPDGVSIPSGSSLDINIQGSFKGKASQLLVILDAEEDIINTSSSNDALSTPEAIELKMLSDSYASSLKRKQKIFQEMKSIMK